VKASDSRVFCSSSCAFAESVAGLALEDRLTERKTSPRSCASCVSRGMIRPLFPLAEELKIVIAIEEVRNKFLLSPFEMVTYISEFKTPLIRAWFDVGKMATPGSTSATGTSTGRRCARPLPTSAIGNYWRPVSVHSWCTTAWK
jgi:hypothetical protein